MDKKERKNKTILTENRLYTINKRETSFEGIVGKLENGEDGIYGMVENNKNILLSPKDPITQKDIDTIPELKELRDSIAEVQSQFKKASGRRKFLLKKQLIEMFQDQYVIRNSYRSQHSAAANNSTISYPTFEDHIEVEPDTGKIIDHSLISFFNPTHIVAIFSNYSRLKQDAWGAFNNDTFYMMVDFDHICDLALADYPMYQDLVTYKIDGLTNQEIQTRLMADYGIKHSIEYISCIWRNKIPKMIAEAASDEYLNWYYTEKERGKWKKCTKCGQIKLANNRFFSKNGKNWYSICKQCRNKKYKEGKTINGGKCESCGSNEE